MLHRIPVRAFRSWVVPVVGVLLLAPATRAQDSGAKVYQTILKSTVWVISFRGEKGEASGSGFLVDKAKNLVVTNYHVVDDRNDVVIAFPLYKDKKLVTERTVYLNAIRDGGGIRGKVVAREKRRDLALLQLQTVPKDAVAVKLAANSPGPGETVHSVGSPGRSGALWLYTQGRVRQVYQAKFRATGDAPGDEPLDLEARIIETDSPTNKGDSGGPLVNDKRELVGVTQGYAPNAQQLSVFIDVSEVTYMLKKNKVKIASPPRATASNEKPKPMPPNPPVATAKDTVDDNDKLEQVAAAKLKLAKQLADGGKVEKAKERYQEIIKSFPKTKAAEEARQLLEKLK